MIVNRQTFLVLGKRCRSGEIDCLPPMWPGFKYRRRRHMWVEFVVGSLLCFKRFFSEYSGFPLSSKTNVSKFRFDQDSGRRWTTLWMCYLQIYLLFDRHPSKLVKINGQWSKLPPQKTLCSTMRYSRDVLVEVCRRGAPSNLDPG